jgi:hypothetical protein
MENLILKRYTNLASLISILKNKKITLLDPSKWEDKNDSNYILKYGERKGLKTIFALCFTTAPETSHHWKVFSHGSDGVCIKFSTGTFIEHLNSMRDIIHGKVDYKFIDEVEKESFTVNQLPFLKRYAFRDELEYRVIYYKKTASKKNNHEIQFDLSMIKEISLSNSMPKELRGPVVQLLRSIEGCSNMKISRTTLNENDRWKRAGARAT